MYTRVPLLVYLASWFGYGDDGRKKKVDGEGPRESKRKTRAGPCTTALVDVRLDSFGLNRNALISAQTRERRPIFRLTGDCQTASQK